jgi:hypothetical protein
MDSNNDSRLGRVARHGSGSGDGWRLVDESRAMSTARRPLMEISCLPVLRGLEMFFGTVSSVRRTGIGACKISWPDWEGC